MPSTYTTNLGIEKIATGEQSGTWGTTTNTNLDLIDEAVNGVEQVTIAAAGSSGSPTDLEITNGLSSNGRNKFIEFIDGGDLGGTAFVQLTPNDAEKVVHIRNSLSADRTITIFQGTYNASNDFVIPNGADVVLKFDGAGAGAVVSDVNVNLTPTKLTTATADITTVNATTVDSTNLEVTNLKAKDGTSAGSIADSTGVVTLASSVLTTTDINGGSVDGATLGTNSAITEAQVDNININGNAITSTDTNGDITISPDGTGTVVIDTDLDVDNINIDGNAITSTDTNGNIALTPDGTGEVDISKVDIDGGTIDDTTIGGSTPAAGSFTGLTVGDGHTIGNGNGDNLEIISGSAENILLKSSGGIIAWNDNSGNEYMRIDSSGNLLVGTTDTNPATNNVNGFATIGNITEMSRSAGEVLRINRGNDGTIVNFKSGGATVGSIGYISSGLYIDGESGHAGLRFGGADISPRDGGADADAAIQLGSSSNRFTDLYLSGGVYLGGTGAANYLDDYEEGTWTPTFVPQTNSFSSITYDSSVTGRYVKVGDIVHVAGFVSTDSLSVGSAAGNLLIGGLPFTVANSPADIPLWAGSIGFASAWGGDTPSSLLAEKNTTNVNIYYRNSANAATFPVNVSDMNTTPNDNTIYFSVSYRTA